MRALRNTLWRPEKIVNWENKSKANISSATYPWGEGQGQRKGCTGEGSQEDSGNGGET